MGGSLAPTNAPLGWSIGVAESTDQLKWRKFAELLAKQVCEQNGLCAPGAWILDSSVDLSYQTLRQRPARRDLPRRL